MILKKAVGVLTAMLLLVTGFTLATTTSANAASTRDSVVTVSTRANMGVTSSTYGNVISYRVNVDKTTLAWATGAERSTLDWTADVYITGPGGYFYYDLLWDDNAWQNVSMYGPKAGTYTVWVFVDADGWTWNSSLHGYYNYHELLYTTGLKETVVVKNKTKPNITLKRTSAAKVDRNATKPAQRYVTVKGTVKNAKKGKVQLVVDGSKKVSANVAKNGSYTLKYDPPNNMKPGKKTLKVYYNGADPYLLSGTSKAVSVQVVK